VEAALQEREPRGSKSIDTGVLWERDAMGGGSHVGVDIAAVGREKQTGENAGSLGARACRAGRGLQREEEWRGSVAEAGGRRDRQSHMNLQVSCSFFLQGEGAPNGRLRERAGRWNMLDASRGRCMARWV
jgi:hypothetical protein